LKMKN